MKKRVLLVTNTPSMVKLFNMRNIRILQQLGHQVFVATNFGNSGTITATAADRLKSKLTEMGVKYFNVPFARGLGGPVINRRAYQALSEIVVRNNIDAIHTHAPLSSVISRQVAHKKKVKCLYTSHGFQFFPHGPLKNWLFYGVEHHYARYADALITINKDDYRMAKTLPAKRIYYLPGVGTKVKGLLDMAPAKKQLIRERTRASLGIQSDEFMVVSVGELSKRKNHATVLRAIARLHNPKVRYVIVGIGPEKGHLTRLAKELGVSNQLTLVGFQYNVQRFYLAADLNAFLSLREGLGMGGLEGCVLGLYILASANTGVKDYVVNENMGMLLQHPRNATEVAQAIQRVMDQKIVAKPDESVLMRYDNENVDRIMTKIYEEELG